MTDQELFDRVASHLLSQNRKSLSGRGGSGACMYLAPDGARCAAGCLIPDDCYILRMEGKPVGMLPPGHFGITTMQIELLSALQDVHDSQRVERWRVALEEVARTFGLKADILAG